MVIWRLAPSNAATLVWHLTLNTGVTIKLHKVSEMGLFMYLNSALQAQAGGRLQCPEPGSLSGGPSRSNIRDSWQRCLDAGLDPGRRPQQADSSSQELRELIDQESFLVRIAQQEFHKLQLQLPDNDCLIGLSNHDAIVIDVACSSPTIRSASKAFPGSCWREAYRGTNAIGTAAFSGSPTAVCLQEHFLRDYGGLTCLAATISSPDGEMAGIISMSSNHPIHRQHNLSLLSMSALHIESELFRRRYRSEIVLQFHSREEFADTLDAGLIALDEDGMILASNRQARFILEGIPFENGHHFDEVFRVPFREFLARRRATGNIAPLVDIKGSSSAARIHMPGNHAKFWPASKRTLQLTEPASETIPFVCDDPFVSHAVTMAGRAVAMSVPILIRGETGTGKELLARYMHQLSGRHGSFVAVNCAAVPESLIESELFGYRKGAFTGASSGGSKGLILQADRGTLFLDEIGDMPVNLQPAILRFLDNWTVHPIGSNGEVKVDVQLITATNCDLENAVSEKRFRSDLLHRIQAVEIVLPPLRDRSDFDAIARDLLGQIAPHLRIAEDALGLLREQRWDGNMRELRNVLVRSVLECDGPCLSAEAVKPFLSKTLLSENRVSPEAATLLDLRRRAVLDAYHRSGGNISKAARSLSVSRNTLYRELRQAGLIDGGARGPAAQPAQPPN